MAQSDALVTAYREFQQLIELERYEEAVSAGDQVLRIGKDELGAESAELASLTYQVAQVRLALGRGRSAAPLLERALAMFRASLGADHPAVAMVASDLAAVRRGEARFEEARVLYQLALDIRETELGESHPDVGVVLNDLAELYREQGFHSEAEALLIRSLEIDERTLGRDHPEIATTLNNLALVYELQGRYAEAEALHRRSLGIKEQARDPGSVPIANTLNNLAGVYRRQGRHGEAELLYRRARAINQETFGPMSRQVAVSINNLAVLAAEQGQWELAKRRYRQSLEIFETALGADHHILGAVLNGMAEVHKRQKDYAAARLLLQRALTLQRRAFGEDHFEIGITANNLGALYQVEGDLDRAKRHLERARVIFDRSFGAEHPLVASALANLAGIAKLQEDRRGALELIRRSTRILRRRAGRARAQRSGALDSEQRSLRPLFGLHLQVIGDLVAEGDSGSDALVAEAFEVAQLTRTSSTAQAVARMSARFALGDDQLAKLVRERRNLLERWRHLDQQILHDAVRPIDLDRETPREDLRAALSVLSERLARLDRLLAGEFPDYAEIANPRPLALTEAQRLLNSDEAIIAFIVMGNESFVLGVRSDRASMSRVDLGTEALRQAVSRIRASLSSQRLFELDDLLARGYAARDAVALYRSLIVPAEPLLEGARHVFVVPDDALQSLPLGVLLTDRLDDLSDFRAFSDYREAPWLARKFAMTTLPSVSSLRALRRFARAARSRAAFFGFGNPRLEGRPGNRTGDQRGPRITEVLRGVLADTRALKELAPLPETADELRRIATSLGADETSLRLGRDMTERAAKSSDLSGSRVIAFATHGLVAGELYGTAEPALVFTPPDIPTAEDDGLLTASEIAREVDLDADWVILSACNTASGDAPGAEGLSGLAKAFFYAGSRALLVSHWPVSSRAAVELTTGLFSEISAASDIGGAEALRRSMLAMMRDPEAEYFAHPLFWAPFVVVGEGGRPAAE